MARPTSTATFKLNNGVSFPAVGLGTWQGAPGSDNEVALENSIVHSLHNGYRLIDTAQSYGVEAVVGRAIRKSGIPRSDITVVSKFWGDMHHDPAEALRNSLKNLDMEYIDLFLMHWPQAITPEGEPLPPNESPTIVETWKMMEPLVGSRCRAIGVSNFSQKTLDELIASAKIIPAINQVEVHALHPCLKLVPYCQSKGIHVMGWGTLGGAGEGANIILTHDLFTDIAEAHECSSGIVSLSWAVQRGITVIPKSGTKSRIEENIKLITLSDNEMEKMNNAHKSIKQRRTADYIAPLWKEVDGRRAIMGWTAVELGWDDEEGNWLV